MAVERPPADLWDTGVSLVDAVLGALAQALELAGLEARLAARSLARALLLALLGLLLIVCACLLAQAALIAGLLAAGLPVWGALALTAAINAVAFALVGRRRRELLKAASFRATRRQLATLRRPTYGDAATAP